MCLNSYWTLQACQSSMELHRHDGLRWGMLVSDQACQSLMKHVKVSDGCLIYLQWVSDQARLSLMGLWHFYNRSSIIIIFLWTQYKVVLWHNKFKLPSKKHFIQKVHFSWVKLMNCNLANWGHIILTKKITSHWRDTFM